MSDNQRRKHAGETQVREETMGFAFEVTQVSNKRASDEIVFLAFGETNAHIRSCVDTAVSLARVQFHRVPMSAAASVHTDCSGVPWRRRLRGVGLCHVAKTQGNTRNSGF